MAETRSPVRPRVRWGMPPDRVCAAAGRADASDAPTSAPRISRRWGLKSCMGEILAPPRGARRTPWPVAGGQRPGGLSYSAGAAAATTGGATASGALAATRFAAFLAAALGAALGVCWALRNAAQRFLVAAMMRARPSALSTRFCGLGAAGLAFAAL